MGISFLKMFFFLFVKLYFACQINSKHNKIGEYKLLVFLCISPFKMTTIEYGIVGIFMKMEKVGLFSVKNVPVF